MALGLVKVGIGAVLLALVSVGYRLATKQPNEDSSNYEVTFEVLSDWKEIPHNPTTLLLMRNPRDQALIRCAATQIIDDHNPEPDMDTANTIRRAVQSAQENQADSWRTETYESYDNGRVKFGMFLKSNAEKAILIAMSVRGNTTMVASMSNTGAGAKAILDGKIDDFLRFLDSVDLTLSDKWIKIHAKDE